MRQNNTSNIVEQDHRGVKESDTADAGIQSPFWNLKRNPYRHNRDDAHDQEGADGLSRRITRVRNNQFYSLAA